MDTKLIRYSKAFKITAFLMAIISAGVFLFALGNFDDNLNKITFPQDIDRSEYLNSYQYQSDKSNLTWNYIEEIIRLKSEDYITNTLGATEIEIANRKHELYRNNYYDMRDRARFDGIWDDNTDYYNITPKALEAFEKYYKTEIENIRDNIIKERIAVLNKKLRELKENSSIVFYVKIDNHNIYQNTEKDFNAIAASNDEVFYKKSTGDEQYIFAYKREYIKKTSEEYKNAQNDAKKRITYMSLSLLAFLLSLGYLIYASGRKAKAADKMSGMWIDRLYNEITLSLLIFAVIFAGFSLFYYIKIHWWDISYGIFTISIYMIFFLILVALSIFFLLSLVRSIKRKQIFKHSFIFKFFYILYRGIRKIKRAFGKIWGLPSPLVKLYIIILGLGLLTMIPFAGIVTIPIAAFLSYKQIMNYQKIKDGVQNIKNGAVGSKIEINGEGELARLSANINEISEGLSEEVERRIKSERLKTELIVNVSHDIKTPLTSVLTYVDLLKKEETDNENIKKYTQVIAKKSDRLKSLIDDLFEASKAASGNIAVSFEQVDIGALITQGLGELDDKVQSSSLDFRVNMPDTKLLAWADGRLLWRVLENLLSNVFKYSLENSRVYIDVFDDKDNAYIEIKNISANELNIPADEITERFKRGDESRNSEGSGLGLDIAKSLMHCQNGELFISVDGDLFKAKLKIGKTQTNSK